MTPDFRPILAKSSDSHVADIAIRAVFLTKRGYFVFWVRDTARGLEERVTFVDDRGNPRAGILAQ